MLARRRLGLKSHSRSSPLTGGLILGACLQSTRAARESFRTSGIHEYPRCPADSANGGGRCSVQSHRAAAFFSPLIRHQHITGPDVAPKTQHVTNKEARKHVNDAQKS